MRVIGLVSGGKDSVFSLLECIRYGHEIVALGHIFACPSDPRTQQGGEERDSFLFQTVGGGPVSVFGQCMGIPLFRASLSGSSLCTSLEYDVTRDDETEDLFRLLSFIQDRIPNVEAVASGAILSTYQRLRVENVYEWFYCSRLGLTSLAYLWERDQHELLTSMIDDGIDARIIKTAAMGLFPSKHLGLSLSDAFSELCRLNKDVGLHICGEGGEYETLVLDAPIFRYRIILDKFEVTVHTEDPYSPVSYFSSIEFSLMDKLSHQKVEIDPSFIIDVGDYFPSSMFDSFSKLLSSQDIREMDEEAQRQILSGIVVCSWSPSVLVGKWIRPRECEIFSASNPSFVRETMRQLCSSIQDEMNLSKIGFSQVVHVCMQISDMNLFSLLNSVYVEFFQLNKPPARECTGISPFSVSSSDDLDLPHIQLILFFAGSFEYASSCPNRNLHVQSISSWAPACIGPYSQSSSAYEDEVLFVAGQIALDPPRMTLVQFESVIDELNLCCDHVLSILACMGLRKDPHMHVSMLTLFCVCHEDMQFLLSAVSNRFPRSLVSVVEVSQLPRGARVEIQCMASRSELLFPRKANIRESSSCWFGLFPIDEEDILARVDGGKWTFLETGSFAEDPLLPSTSQLLYERIGCTTSFVDRKKSVMYNSAPILWMQEHAQGITPFVQYSNLDDIDFRCKPGFDWKG